MAQISIGAYRPQKIKNGLIIPLPKVWVNNFPGTNLEELDFYIDETKALVIKVPEPGSPPKTRPRKRQQSAGCNPKATTEVA